MIHKYQCNIDTLSDPAGHLMATHLDQRIQAAFRAFADIEHWRSPHAVTLTMKQGVRDPMEPASATEFLTSEKAVQNFRHFMNLLNRRVLGKRFQHHGKALSVIPVIEGTKQKRYHYHAIIDCPRADLQEVFPDLIREAWVKTKFGYYEVNIDQNCDDGWTKYISKLRDKTSISDSIDWTNYHNPN